MGDESQVIKSLSGKKLIKALEAKFPQEIFHESHKIQIVNPNFSISYIWCKPITKFIAFLENQMRIQSQNTYHDALKFFVAKTQLRVESKYDFERNIAKNIIDLVETTHKGKIITHEIKTREIISFNMFKTKFNQFLNHIQTDSSVRTHFWFIFLRLCKDINKRDCFKFLGLVHFKKENLPPNLTQRQRRIQFVEEVLAAMQSTEKKIIKQEKILPSELDEEGLFGVENQITYSLRKRIIEKEEEIITIIQEKEQKLQEKEQKLQEKEQKLQEKEQKLQEKEQKLQEKDEEIKKLKALLNKK
jgi:hypothetical protein